MGMLASIFFDFNLPSATTWFYFSLLLAIALFFKFTRVLSIRNWDVLTLFLLVPGLLLLQEANKSAGPDQKESGPVLNAPSSASADGLVSGPSVSPTVPIRWIGYLWLLCGSAYFLLRCLLDLTLVRRPALGPNLNSGGLGWLALALFVCLTVVDVRGAETSKILVGKPSVALTEAKRHAEDALKHAPMKELPDVLECTAAMTCHLAIVIGLIVIGWRHFQDPLSGMAMATFYLLLPYTAYLVGQVHHILPTALLVWAVVAFRSPTLSGLLLGIATGTGYFPALIVPAWLSFYWRRGAGRFAGAFLLALCVVPLTMLFWSPDELGTRIREAFAQADWQPWKTQVESVGFWKDVRWAWAYRLPVFIAYLALVATTLFWPRPKNLAHLLALTAAVILGIQFWFADQGGIYVLWYLPFLLLLVFRPNLGDREPDEIDREKDWLTRCKRAVTRSLSRVLKLPEPTIRVH